MSYSSGYVLKILTFGLSCSGGTWPQDLLFTQKLHSHSLCFWSCTFGHAREKMEICLILKCVICLVEQTKRLLRLLLLQYSFSPLLSSFLYLGNVSAWSQQPCGMRQIKNPDECVSGRKYISGDWVYVLHRCRQWEGPIECGKIAEINSLQERAWDLWQQDEQHESQAGTDIRQNKSPFIAVCPCRHRASTFLTGVPPVMMPLLVRSSFRTQ